MESRINFMKWWGWGDPQLRFAIEDYPGLQDFLETRLGTFQIKPASTFNVAYVKLPDSQLPSLLLDELRARVSTDSVSVSHGDRVLHSVGKSYKDLIRIRSLHLLKAPDVVFFPKSEDEVVEFLKFCRQHGIAVVPFGGGTSVVRGVEPEKGKHSYVAALNTRRLNKVLRVDTLSRTAEVQAGILGPELEQYLGKKNFTLGHFPQSFEFSTLGGWIAARSSGQNSLRYGGIEKLVVSLKVATPEGVITTHAVPRHAEGPDLKEILIGSEGTLGVILSAIVRISPKPAHQDYFMVMFKNFKEATAATRAIAQSSIKPALIRTSDEMESMTFFSLSKATKNFAEETFKNIFKKYLTLRGFNLSSMSIMLIGLEGERESCEKDKASLKALLAQHGAVHLGSKPGQKWLKDRFFLPYLRDELLNSSVLIETLETSIPWEKFQMLYDGVQMAIMEQIHRQGLKGILLAHISHLYPDGASLYFTILCPQQRGKEIEQWDAIKEAANHAIQKNGGAISHHHGIGMDHKNYVFQSSIQKNLMNGLKQSCDPTRIMNPEKLFSGPEA